MRRTSRRDAGRLADINHRCAFRSSHSYFQVLSKVVWQVEPLQPLSSNRSRLTDGGKKRLKQQSFLNPKQMGFRIIPGSYLKLPILNLGTFAGSELVFCELFSLQPFATGYTTTPAVSEKNRTTAPCSGILQWHQHANSKAHTPL